VRLIVGSIAPDRARRIRTVVGFTALGINEGLICGRHPAERGSVTAMVGMGGAGSTAVSHLDFLLSGRNGYLKDLVVGAAALGQTLILFCMAGPRGSQASPV
jgi:hypothetical protein